MCTVTVLRRGRDTLISMNRDEQRTRHSEQPPAPWPHGNLTAPRDGMAGGTWMGLTPQGDWACLLNSYVPYAPPAPAPSRGGIVPELLLADDTPATALAAMDVARYRPFRLLLGRHAFWELFHWDGQALQREAHSDGADFIVTSSSWNADAVLPARHAAFAQWQTLGRPYDAQGIPLIHRWQEAGDERSGILMARTESHTTSLTQIILTQDAAPAMRYWTASQLAPVSLQQPAL